MYMEIDQLRQLGFSKSKIAKKLGIARGTVLSYCKKDPEEMALWLASTKQRRSKLDPYREDILSWLREHPDFSHAQVADRLEEHYPAFKIGESTVRRYVKSLREAYKIPKETHTRTYEAVPELPMGLQMQVDFGEIWLRNEKGQPVKLYTAAFVLAHSRYKYMEWQDRPFTARDLVALHENAFRYFGGKPIEMVYDQDSIIVVSENHGDIVYTKEFEAYRRSEGFRIRMCRGADPESKGKIENVIKFIKNNFARHRIYTTLDDWNDQAILWLERRGNGKIHNTTKKRPAEVFLEEKQYLQPVRALISVAPEDKQNTKYTLSITRVVRKDNTILYKANRYSVPLGTYHSMGKEVAIRVEEKKLCIIDPETGEILADHGLDAGKGNLIQDKKHRRDRSKGIEAYLKNTAAKFQDEGLAYHYLDAIRKQFPRYVRDQLQIINKQWNGHPSDVVNQALEACHKQKLYSASEFQDMIHFLTGQKQEKKKTPNRKELQPLHTVSSSALAAKPAVRDMKDYIQILEGADVWVP